MATPADDIPDLEQLLRNVTRAALETQLGSDWLSKLSAQQQSNIRSVAARAQAKRPNEVLQDDWGAVGLGEIRSLIRSTWPTAFDRIWPSAESADVDLTRLIDFRGKNLHAVGPPSGQVLDQEVAAIILRLRVGLEAVHRDLLDESGSWWPFIAAVHSNIPAFTFERSSKDHLTASATLNEGDLVTL